MKKSGPFLLAIGLCWLTTDLGLVFSNIVLRGYLCFVISQHSSIHFRQELERQFLFCSGRSSCLVGSFPWDWEFAQSCVTVAKLMLRNPSFLLRNQLVEVRGR